MSYTVHSAYLYPNIKCVVFAYMCLRHARGPVKDDAYKKLIVNVSKVNEEINFYLTINNKN